MASTTKMQVEYAQTRIKEIMIAALCAAVAPIRAQEDKRWAKYQADRKKQKKALDERSNTLNKHHRAAAQAMEVRHKREHKALMAQHAVENEAFQVDQVAFRHSDSFVKDERFSYVESYREEPAEVTNSHCYLVRKVKADPMYHSFMDKLVLADKAQLQFMLEDIAKLYKVKPVKKEKK